jgi:hypothetical protein
MIPAFLGRTRSDVRSHNLGQSLPSPAPLPEAPSWVSALLGLGEGDAAGFGEESEALATRLVAHGRFALASARVRGALGLDEEAFRERAGAAYARIQDALAPLVARRVVRIWNFIPRILEPLGCFPNRYMAFNHARYHALAAWEPGGAPGPIIAASGVGHDGEDLIVHALATVAPGRAVENPRQVAAYRYSVRYGPLPPCFARATVVPAAGRHWLLVSGTASVRGEESVHAGDLGAQASETLENLRSVVAAGAAAIAPSAGVRRACLCRFRHLRVYCVDAGRRAEVAALMRSAFRRMLTLEIVRADLCRPELLLEIEGVAELDD